MTRVASFLVVLSFLSRSLASPGLVAVNEELYPLAILHINDFHARFEETNRASGICKPGDECIGGFARVVAKVKELKAKHSDKNVVLLDAGDNFQGTLWYTLLRGKVTAEILNLMAADATTLGNHEFDHGIDGCVPYLQELTSPVVVSNIDDSLEPNITGLYQKSVVIERGGRKIGIIGVILQTTDLLANTGKLKFLDETETVKEEAAKLTSEGVDIIIVLSHSGLDVDERIAENVGEHVDVIVGGHTHTFLYTGEDHPGIDPPAKAYPVVVRQRSGHEVLVVQAASFAKYIGELVVYFDANGKITRSEGNPVFLGPDVPQDPAVVEFLAPYKVRVDEQSLRPIGSTLTTLDRSPCNRRECSIANLVTDAFRSAGVARAGPGEWTSAEISFNNVGGIRTSMERGNITFGDAVGVLPFENMLVEFEIRGDKILQALEFSVQDPNVASFRNMLHYSGLRVTFNFRNDPGYRVVKAEVVCRRCSVPVFEPLDSFKTYKVIMPTFVADGGDGFSMFRDYGKNRQFVGLDIDVFESYIEAASPLLVSTEGRITIL